MRDRLYIAAASSSTMAARHSSSRGPVGGQSRWRRGFCDGQSPWDLQGKNGGVFVGGDEHLTTVSEENYVQRVGWRGDAWVSGPSSFHPPPPGPGFSSPPPHGYLSTVPHHPSFRHQAPQPYGPTGPRGLWRPVWPDFGPRPQFRGAPPRQSWQGPHPAFRPHPPRPRLPPADFRKWVSSSLPPPPAECGRFTVLSYNILADYLARDHWSKLYFHIPPEVLDWEWRKSRLFIEFGLWSPDIMCLQEVDRFQDLEKELALRGYNGVWKMRTGDAVDGCAVFWRACRFVLRHEEHIEFAKLGLRDNVAQICVLESSQSPCNSSAASPARSHPSLGIDRVVVCNIHVLYNPKRGEIKLGQVRTLLNQAYSVSKIWDDAPVIICGDFNCTPKSPLYNFISEQKLNLSGLARNTVSGQYSPIYYPPRTFNQELGMKSHHSDKGITDNALQGIEMDGSDNSTTCEEKYSPTETSVDMLQPGDIVTSEEREGADSSRNASSQGVALPSTVDFQYPCSSGETLRSILDQHLVTTSGNIEAKADTIDLLHEVNSSTTHARLKEEFTGIEMTKDASNSSNNIPSRVGDKDGLTPHGVDNSSDSIPDVVILNRTSCQWISKAITFSSESIAVSPVGLPSDLERTILDVSRHNSHEDKNLDSCLDFATEDLSAGHTTEKVENLSTLSVQVMAERVTSYTVLDVTEAGISDISDGNAALEASSCPIDEGEEGSSDPTFLEELHGPSNVQESMEVLSGASFSSQWMRRSYPDPFLWTPMEITAASGNPETTSLEHNLKLKSAYTEVEDYAGTKDSNGEPKVTSYNRQFMGTVDYIWHSEGLQTVRVLDTIPQNVLRRTCGFPTRKWGSDHIALVCEFAFKKT